MMSYCFKLKLLIPELTKLIGDWLLDCVHCTCGMELWRIDRPRTFPYTLENSHTCALWSYFFPQWALLFPPFYSSFQDMSLSKYRNHPVWCILHHMIHNVSYGSISVFWKLQILETWLMTNKTFWDYLNNGLMKKIPKDRWIFSFEATAIIRTSEIWIDP
jgi:hypothetical protein